MAYSAMTEISGVSLIESPRGQSAVAWGAVLAGAAVAAALSLTLIVGGAGLGFLAASPWSEAGASAEGLGIASIIWLFFTQLIAYGVAGYLAGRLRRSWSSTYSDETYFRDSAHGLLVWAVSALFAVVLFGSAVISAGSGAASAVGRTAAGVASVATQGAVQAGGNEYFSDALLRPAPGAPAEAGEDVRAEVGRILARSVAQGAVSAEDREYLVERVAARAGISSEEAERRLNEIVANLKQSLAEAETTAKQAADAARKSAALFSLWAFASLLFGAFIATYMAVVGGRHFREP